MEAHSCYRQANASPSHTFSASGGAPPKPSQTHEANLRTTAKAALLYSAFGVLDAIYMTVVLDGGVHTVLLRTLICGVLCADLWFRRSRFAIGAFIFFAAFSTVYLGYFVVLGSYLAGPLMILNIMFGAVFVRGYMAARRLHRAETA